MAAERSNRRRIVVGLGTAGVVALMIGVVVVASRSDHPATTVTADSDGGDVASTTTEDLVVPEMEPSTTTSSGPPPASSTTAPAVTPSTSPATTTTAPAPLVCDTAPPAPKGVDVVAVGTSDGIHEVAVDGSADFLVPGTRGVDHHYTGAAWDRSGRRVAYVQRTQGTYAARVVVVDLADGCWRPVTPDDGLARDQPAWPPGGGRVGYRRSNEGPGFDPDKTTVDATDVVDLHTMTVVDRSHTGPAWAPDGSGRVAYADGEGLKILDPATRRVTLVHAASSAEFPEWSPDGSQLVFSISVDSAVWLVRADGAGGARKISPPDLWQIFWTSWSPDGNLLAFVGRPRGASTADAGPHGVWIMRPDGSEPRVVPSTDSAAGKPRWSPDGRRLAFESVVGTGSSVVVDVEMIDLDGTNRRVIAKDARLFGYFRRAA